MALTTMTWAASAQDPYPPCSAVPSPADVEAAKGAHKLAEQFYAKGKYDRAVGSWTDAYSFDCRAHRLLINIGNAYEKVGQTAKAIKAFETYIARMGDKAERTIVAKVENLKQSLRVVPQPPPPPPPPPNGNEGADGGPGVAPWLVVGSGGALVVVGAVVLGIGGGKVSDAELRCPDRKCPPDDPQAAQVQDDGNTGRSMQGVGGTLVGIGAAAIAGGVVWYLLSAPPPADAEATPASGARLQPWVGPNGGGLGLTGTF